MDTLDRLGYVIDLEKSQKKVVVGVAYQVPRSLVGSAGGAGISAAELQTMLETEESTFDRIRPYKGETVICITIKSTERSEAASYIGLGDFFH